MLIGKLVVFYSFIYLLFIYMFIKCTPPSHHAANISLGSSSLEEFNPNRCPILETELFFIMFLNGSPVGYSDGVRRAMKEGDDTKTLVENFVKVQVNDPTLRSALTGIGRRFQTSAGKGSQLWQVHQSLSNMLDMFMNQGIYSDSRSLVDTLTASIYEGGAMHCGPLNGLQNCGVGVIRGYYQNAMLAATARFCRDNGTADWLKEEWGIEPSKFDGAMEHCAQSLNQSQQFVENAVCLLNVAGRADENDQGEGGKLDPIARGMSAIVVDKNGTMTKIHPDGSTEPHEPEPFYMTDLKHLERRKYRWWEGTSEIQKVPRDQTLVYSMVREDGALPTTAKKKSVVSKPTENVIPWNNDTKAPTKYNPGEFLTIKKKSRRRKGKLDPSRNHVATSKEMMGYESSGSEFDPEEEVRLTSSLLSELSVGEGGKIKHPTAMVVAFANHCQVDLPSLFHSKYGKLVDYYLESNCFGVDGDTLWDSTLHFNARDDMGWRVVESMGPDFACPVGMKKKGSEAGYRSKVHSVNAVVLKYLAVMHPEEITSWTHQRNKEGKVEPILQLMTNGKRIGILSRDKNAGDRIYIFDETYLEMVANKKMPPGDAGVQLLCTADVDWASKIGGSKSRKGRHASRRQEKRRRNKKRKKEMDKSDETQK